MDEKSTNFSVRNQYIAAIIGLKFSLKNIQFSEKNIIFIQ